MRIQEFDSFIVDVKQSILWQYDNATNLLGLINQKQIWYDLYQSQFWEDWYNNVFNLQTANFFGVELWSKILNLPFLVPTQEISTQPTFGFNAFEVTNLSDTSVLSIGMSVSGTGIQAGTLIQAIIDSTTIDLDQAMTSTGTQSLTFSLDLVADTTNGSDVVSNIADTSVLSAGMDVSGAGIPGGTTILNIIDGTSITLDANATADGTGVTLTFSLVQSGDIDTPGLINDNLNYLNGNFNPYNNELILTLEQQRWMLKLRYFQLNTLTNIAGMQGIEPPQIYSINWFLNYLCTDNDIDYNGTIYVIDNLDMTITYNFTDLSFPVTLFQTLVKYDVFPRPAGVEITFTGI